jgi:hypothetical protein
MGDSVALPTNQKSKDDGPGCGVLHSPSEPVEVRHETLNRLINNGHILSNLYLLKMQDSIPKLNEAVANSHSPRKRTHPASSPPTPNNILSNNRHSLSNEYLLRRSRLNSKIQFRIFLKNNHATSIVFSDSAQQRSDKPMKTR